MALVSEATLGARHMPGKTLCSSHSRTQAGNHEFNQKEEKFRKQPSLWLCFSFSSWFCHCAVPAVHAASHCMLQVWGIFLTQPAVGHCSRHIPSGSNAPAHHKALGQTKPSCSEAFIVFHGRQRRSLFFSDLFRMCKWHYQETKWCLMRNHKRHLHHPSSSLL